MVALSFSDPVCVQMRIDLMKIVNSDIEDARNALKQIKNIQESN